MHICVFPNPNQSSVLNPHTCPGPGMWGGGGGPQTVDDGTAAWGKVADASSGWGEPDEAGKTSGWRNPSPNPGKPGNRN